MGAAGFSGGVFCLSSQQHDDAADGAHADDGGFQDGERGEVRDSCGRLLTHHTFGHNYYFMAGDNVCDSNDSRYWGLVPEQYIIGVAQCVLYGRDSQTGRLRRHRFMRSLR